MPTFLSAAGAPGIVEKVKNGYEANGKTWKVHLDGYDFLPYFKGEVDKGPRDSIIYFAATGELNAVRWTDWKVHFATQQGAINTAFRQTPAWPLVINLKADPYEKAVLESEFYIRWYADNMWLFVPIQQGVKQFLATIPDYPFQSGSTLNASGISYNSLRAQQALQRLREIKNLSPPRN